MFKKRPPRDGENTTGKSSTGIVKGMAPLSKLNKTTLRKKIIKALDRTKLTPNDKELGWIYAQEYMKAGGGENYKETSQHS